MFSKKSLTLDPVYLLTRAPHIPIHPVGNVRAVPMDPGSFLSQAATPDSAGQCGSVCASPNEAAGSVNTPRPPKLRSAAVLLSCPTHESPQKTEKEQQNIKTFYLHVLTHTYTLYLYTDPILYFHFQFHTNK